MIVNESEADEFFLEKTRGGVDNIVVWLRTYLEIDSHSYISQ